jgi:hypothetical protein
MDQFDIKIPNKDLYGDLIRDAIMLTFPTTAATNDSQILDGVVGELIGTHNVRLGPAPNPESLVAIRAIVRKSIENGKSIPILIPWGSKKTDNVTSVDIAEIMGLKMLHCLNQRVSQIYPAGLAINIRIEDLSGFYIFDDEGEKAIAASNKYVNDFIKLIQILGLGYLISPIKETSLYPLDEFYKLADFIKEKLFVYLEESDKNGMNDQTQSFKDLMDIGWTGPISMEQRQYYYHRYEKIYKCTPDEARMKLAKYLASCLARYKANMRGVDPAWGKDFLELTFCPPIPGVPESLVSKRLYYRTIHCKYTRDHIPPWRGKGYLRIYNNNTVTPTVAPFNTIQEYFFNEVEISGFGQSLKFVVDYVLK